MAITINKQPAEFHSAYNPVEYEITSTFSSELGFRYVVELFQGNTRFAKFFVAPDVTDGNKGKIDISRILQNKLDGFFANDTYNSADAVGTYFQYQIIFGESRIGQWNFNDYVWVEGEGGALHLTTDSAYGAGFSNATHNYQVGDQILVKTSTTYPNDNRQFLNTYFEVVKIISDKTIQLNARFSLIGSFPATPGTTTFADNRKVITRNVENVTKTAINTAMNRKEYITSLGSLDSYDMATGTDNLILTNQPEHYSVTPEQHIYFNVLKGQNNAIIFENSNGDVFRKYIYSSPTVASVGVGPGNLGSSLTPLTGTAPLIKADTKWYTVKVASNDNTTDYSIKYKFNLDKRCQINPIQIQFMDRKGSFNSFAFQLKKRENVQTNKESYNKFVNDNTTYAAGNTVYHSEAEKTLTLTTNFMGEAMNLYFEELMTSRRTYILIDGDWYSCTVQDSSFENEFARNNKMINKQITVKFDLNNTIN